MNVPVAIAIDDRGDVFIADAGNNRVRRIDAGGTITSVAAGVALKVPLGVAIDTSGYVLVADTYNDRVVRFRQ